MARKGCEGTAVTRVNYLEVTANKRQAAFLGQHCSSAVGFREGTGYLIEWLLEQQNRAALRASYEEEADTDAK